MIDQDRTTDLLNRLFAAESTSLLPRLAELSPFASAEAEPSFELIQRIARESREHCEWLIEAIESAGGCVRPVSPDPRSGNLHYLSIEALVPLARRSLQELIAVYAAAAQERLVSVSAADLVARILARHQADLKELQATLAPGPGRV
jgi:hypothetical protein